RYIVLAYVAPPIYRGGAAKISVGICVVGLVRLWVMGPMAMRVPSLCLRPATMAPPAVVPVAGRYIEEIMIVEINTNTNTNTTNFKEEEENE
ncbi:hypothetical protein ACLOJK_015151, partial [Asimina triloba]